MTRAFVIQGGRELAGEIVVRGSKNAALPILAATLLTKEKCRIQNLPRVLDVMVMIETLEQMGAAVRWHGKRTVEIENRDIHPDNLSKDSVKKMRASILLLGPLLARFGYVRNMQYPGGDRIGVRSIDTHLKAFGDLGAKITCAGNFFSVEMRRHSLLDAVTLQEFSVTATENMLLFLSSLPKLTTLNIAACEPHVRDLAAFLSKMGARIQGVGSSTMRIRGGKKLHGASHKVIPDYIEAGTFLLCALTAGGNVRIKNAPFYDLDLVIATLRAAGADIRLSPRKKTIEIRSLRGARLRNGKRMIIQKIQTLPHPGIPTDLQSAFGVLATQTQGATIIHDPLYEKRFESLKELRKMGAYIKICDSHQALIPGPVKLHGARVTCYDLRGGAALVIAGLAARGTTIVRDVEHIERGYEDIEGRLRVLGASIKKATE
jgi:UDP-N-acetylglucosamine 1-carboxyvinyltransferase